MEIYTTARLLRDRLAAQKPERGGYHLELALEALCEWHLADPDGGWLDPVLAVWERRGWKPGRRIPWKNQPFASHDDALARASGDQRYAAAFIEESAAMIAEVPRDDAGLVTHGHQNPNVPAGRNPLLVDFMHEYAARCASAAALGGEAAWFDEAVRQFSGYAAALRDGSTGLWHLGRDWGERAGTLSPGAWSRGHGWLLRGMVETLRVMPRSHPGRGELVSLFAETVQVLSGRVDGEGMWHVLLHRPHEESEPETSGTALIGYAIGRAIALGILRAEEWADVVVKSAGAVCRRVDADGVVHGACKGPGLLFDGSEANYLHRPLPVDDPHGLPTVLYGCLGARLVAPEA